MQIYKHQEVLAEHMSATVLVRALCSLSAFMSHSYSPSVSGNFRLVGLIIQHQKSIYINF